MGHWPDGISVHPKTAATKETSPFPSPDKGKGTHMSLDCIGAADSPK